MIATLAAAVALAGPVTLWRGAPGDAEFRYWAVEDTFLDSSQADRNFGRDPWLEGGPNRTVLIRFGDLNRVLKGRVVASARLVLHSDMPDAPVLTGVYVVDRPWQEGDGRRGLIAGDVQPPKPVTRGADWRSRGNEKWAVPGGVAGAPISGVSLKTAEDGKVSIEGLGNTLEAMRKAPASHFGLALRFSNPVRFRSSETQDGGPQIIMDAPTFAADRVQPNFAVVNVFREGNQLNSTIVATDGKTPLPVGLVVNLTKNGEPIGTAAAGPHSGDGSIGIYSMTIPAGFDIATTDAIVARLNPGDAEPGDDYAAMGDRVVGAGSMTAPEYAKLGDAVRFMNETVFPQSRFSFAREGVTHRVAIGRMGSGSLGATSSLKEAVIQIVDALGAGFRPKEPNGDMYPGLSGWGDTRDDINLTKFLPMIYDPVPDPLGRDAGLVPTDLLSATQVAMLQLPDFKTRLPNRIGLQIYDTLGEALGNSKVSLRFDSAEPIAEGTLGTQGSWIPVLKDALPWSNQPFSPNTMAAEATISKGPLQATVQIPLWRFVDGSIRSGAPVGLAKAYADLPAVAPDLSNNLAKGRISGDDRGTPSNELARLTDDSEGSGVSYTGGLPVTLELDLTRDRALGAIDFVVAGDQIWPNIEITAYQTGQLASEAVPIFTTARGDYLLRTRTKLDSAGNRTLRLTPRSLSGRYLRVRLEGAGSVQLREVRVYPGLTIKG